MPINSIGVLLSICNLFIAIILMKQIFLPLITKRMVRIWIPCLIPGVRLRLLSGMSGIPVIRSLQIRILPLQPLDKSGIVYKERKLSNLYDE